MRSGKIFLGFLFIAVLFVLMNITAVVKAKDALTIEGEWEVVIPATENDMTNTVGSRLTIYRDGKKYHIGPGPWPSGDDSAYGSSTKLTKKDAFTLEFLRETFRNVPDSVIIELASKNIMNTRTYTLSGDGNTLVVSMSTPSVSYTTTGELVSCKPIDNYFEVVYKRVSGATLDDVFNVAQVESRGEFYFLTKDGRKVSGEEAGNIPLEEGTKVVTGKDGHIKMTLPDNTTFTVGPNSDIVIDEFVYDPDNNPKKVMASMTKGVFRWVTGKTTGSRAVYKDPEQMKVNLPTVAVGIRGTDFEATVQPNGSGSIVLNFGQLEITEKKTGFKFILEAGQKVEFAADGSVSRPSASN